MHIEDLNAGDATDICVLGAIGNLHCFGRFLELVNSGRGKRLKAWFKVSIVGDEVLPRAQYIAWDVSEIVVRRQECEA